jgi:hypothetical protein
VSGWRLALCFAALAATVYLGISLPAAARASAARVELRELQRQREAHSAELGRLRLRDEALVRVRRSPEAASVVGIRGEIVRVVDSVGLDQATVDVRPARPPAAALVGVRARGSFPAVMALSQRLAEPGSGLVLDKVRFQRFPSAVQLALEGRAPGTEE